MNLVQFILHVVFIPVVILALIVAWVRFGFKNANDIANDYFDNMVSWLQ